MTGALAILNALTALAVFVLKQRYSAENIQKRERYERGEALYKGKSKVVGLHLSDLYRKVKHKKY